MLSMKEIYLIRAIKYLLLFGMLLCSHGVFSQEENIPIDVNVVPPSPDASALGKYGEIPTDMASGIPQINLPLYTISNGDLNLDISLSYHAGGHKVKEEASWVGLGWTLSAGGMITRTVRGNDDTGSNGYYSTYFDVEAILNNTSGKLDAMRRIADGESDGQPDIFFYNFAGHSGKFFRDPVSDEYHLMPNNSDLRIEKTGLNEWVITAPDGTGYFFGGSEHLETTLSESSTGNSQYYTSTWLLKQIKSPTRKTIDFSYDDTFSSSSYVDISQSKLITPGYYACSPSPYPKTSKSYSLATYTSRRLTHIDFPEGQIEFVADFSRGDISGTNVKALTKIKIKKKDGSLVKGWEFDYGYFGDDPPNITCSRLKLNFIDALSQEEDEKERYYEFQYNTTELPCKSSYAVDHWGYFNNETTNNTYIPKDEDNRNGRFPDGANRQPVEEYMKACILTQITYPTKGHTRFEYSANEYYTEREIIESGSTYEEIDLRQANAPETITQSIEIDFDQNVTLQYRRYNTGDDPCTSVISLDGQIYGGTHTSIKTEKVFLSAGTYELLASINNYGDAAWCKLTFEEQTGSHMIYSDIAGGLKVDKITRDFNGEITTKIYDYQTDDLESSGYLVNGNYGEYIEDRYDYSFNTYTRIGTGTDCQMKICGTVIGRKSSSSWFLGSGDRPVSYTQVTVTEDAAGSNGKSIHRFTKALNSSGSSVSPPVSYSWRRGLPLENLYKDAAGNDVKREVFDYNKATNIPSPRLTSVFSQYMKNDLCQNDQDQFYEPYTSHYHSEWYRLDEARYYTYHGSNEMETIVINEYGSTSHKNITKVTTYLSNGKTKEECYEYPTDVGTTQGSGVPQKMLEKFMISPVVNEITKINGTKTFESHNDFTYDGRYDYVTLSSKKVYPAGIASDFQQYDIVERDEFGNILHYLLQDGTKVVFSWGYDNTLPVANIVNLSLSYIDDNTNNIQAELDKLDGYTKITSTNRSNLKTNNDAIRTALPPGALITTYTYDPLVGMTSQTDPNGRTTYYEYDEYGRLKFVRDQDFNIIKKHEYHYAGQTSN